MLGLNDPEVRAKKLDNNKKKHQLNIIKSNQSMFMFMFISALADPAGSPDQFTAIAITE